MPPVPPVPDQFLGIREGHVSFAGYAPSFYQPLTSQGQCQGSSLDELNSEELLRKNRSLPGVGVRGWFPPTPFVRRLMGGGSLLKIESWGGGGMSLKIASWGDRVSFCP